MVNMMTLSELNKHSNAAVGESIHFIYQQYQQSNEIVSNWAFQNGIETCVRMHFQDKNDTSDRL